MISFFRDFLNGPIYIIAVIICIILIMAIIGFIMERKKLEKEEQEKKVTIDVATQVERVMPTIQPAVTPVEPVVTKVEPVITREVVLNGNIENSQTIPNPLTNPETELKRDTTFTLNSNDVKVEEVVVANNNANNMVESKVEDVANVIDFGSTEDIKIENL